MELKELVDALLLRFEQHLKVGSSAYGEQEAFSTSKNGVAYQRAYLSLIGATDFDVELKLTVTDEVLADHSNRLEVQSSTLQTARDLIKEVKNINIMPFDTDNTYEPTTLYQEDQSEGWFCDFTIRLDAIANCDAFTPNP